MDNVIGAVLAICWVVSVLVSVWLGFRMGLWRRANETSEEFQRMSRLFKMMNLTVPEEPGLVSDIPQSVRQMPPHQPATSMAEWEEVNRGQAFGIDEDPDLPSGPGQYVPPNVRMVEGR